MGNRELERRGAEFLQWLRHPSDISPRRERQLRMSYHREHYPSEATNSPQPTRIGANHRRRQLSLPRSSSASRFTAGCFGFLLLRATALPFFGGIICPQSPFRMGLAASQSIDSPW
jgi:hypothetical protein